VRVDATNQGESLGGEHNHVEAAMRTAVYRAVLGYHQLRPPLTFAEAALHYLPRLSAVVARDHRTAGGWRCTVVARRGPMYGAGHVDISDAELATAPTTVVFDPDGDPEAVAMLWLVRVWQHWPGRRCYTVARMMLDAARAPGELRLIVAPATVRRLVHSARMRPTLLRRIVARLMAEGFLTPSAVGGYTLALPYESITTVHMG
jgi:hypothetical protein